MTEAAAQPACRPTDWTARCFQAVLIVLVVAGHMGGSFLSGPFGLFPAYSFHVAGFAFVSGYLYSGKADAHVARYAWTRVTKLVLPTMGIYFVYGCVTMVLNHCFGFSLGDDLSLWSVLVAPFTSGHQFKLCLPLWFVMPFAASQIVHVALRAGTGRLCAACGKPSGGGRSLMS